MKQRHYREVTVHATMPEPGPDSGPRQTLAAAPGSTPELAWTAPPGWSERPGNNMRLATFTVEGNECSLSALPGDVGGHRANVERWLGQLDVEPVPEDLMTGFLAEAERVDTEGALHGVVYDFRRFTADGDADATSMLAAALEKDGFTVFVKLMGPRNLLEREAAHFRDLVLSLR